MDYLFTGLGYEGAVPLGMRQIKQSGNDLWLLMRVACSGDKDEVEAVNILQRFGLAKLADLASLPETNVNVPVINAPIEKVLAPLDNLQFFRVMATMLERNLVPDSDRGLLDRWRRICLIPGRFDLAGLSPAIQRGLTRAITAGSRIVEAAQFGIANTINGWNYSDKIGSIKDDWALVAAIARGGYGNMPQDSMYYQRNLDEKGETLTGAYSYTLTFESGRLPPVGEFWSITAYDQKTFDLIENPIQRYSIGDRTPGLTTNADGSLTLYLQYAPPTEAVQQANWLPVAAGQFYLVIRSYDPSPDIISGKWAPPPVLKTL